MKKTCLWTFCIRIFQLLWKIFGCGLMALWCAAFHSVHPSKGFSGIVAAFFWSALVSGWAMWHEDVVARLKWRAILGNFKVDEWFYDFIPMNFFQILGSPQRPWKDLLLWYVSFWLMPSPKKIINNGSVEVKDYNGLIPITEALVFDHWLTCSTTISLRSERAKISLKVVPTPLTILEQKTDTHYMIFVSLQIARVEILFDCRHCS